MMKKPLSFFAMTVIAIALAVLTQPSNAQDEAAGNTRVAELDRYWAKVSRAVKEGDFKAYASTCHPRGVLVSGTKKTSYPLGEALAGWKQGFLDTAAGKMTASVEFRFSQRLGDTTTAHETGIFLYSSTDANGRQDAKYVRFEALLVKENDGWQILMEYQKTAATSKEWEALAQGKSVR